MIIQIYKNSQKTLLSKYRGAKIKNVLSVSLQYQIKHKNNT